MMRYLEGALCLGLALLVHLLFWMGRPEEGVLGGAGAGGLQAISMQASSASFATMVERWERPVEIGGSIEMQQPETPALPETELPSAETAPTQVPALEGPERQEIDHVPETPTTATPTELAAETPRAEGVALQTDTIDRPRQDRRQTVVPPRPMPEAAPVEAPRVDTTPAEPAQTEAAVTRSSPPRARPREARQATPAPQPETDPQRPAVTHTQPGPSNQAASDARPDTTAAGAGEGPVAGNAGRSVVPSMSPAERSSLVAEWGARIVADLNRRSVRTQGRRGTVLLQLTIARDGTVLSASIGQSSGNPRLDRASLAIIRQGAVPAAPTSLQLAQQSFSVPLRIQ